MALDGGRKKVPPIEVEKVLEAKGAVDVANTSLWPHLISGVRAGSKEWLRVAGKALKTSDAGSTHGLVESLGLALHKDPVEVLRAIESKWIKFVCGGPNVDDPKFDGYELALAELETRIRIIDNVANKELKEKKLECLSELTKSRSDLARFYGVDEKKK